MTHTIRKNRPLIHPTRCQAVRTFNRLWNTTAQKMFDVAHAGFDGGEFSGPPHHVMIEREQQRLLGIVAHRYALDSDSLWDSVVSYDIINDDLYRAAVNKRFLDGLEDNSDRTVTLMALSDDGDDELDY